MKIFPDHDCRIGWSIDTIKVGKRKIALRTFNYKSGNMKPFEWFNFCPTCGKKIIKGKKYIN